MAELKGLDKLTEKIENFFTDLGYDEISCFISHEFAYYLTTEEISYTILDNDLADKGYQNYLELYYDKVPNISIFMFSLLHELGHHITLPLIKKRKRRKIKKTKEIYERRLMKTAKTPEDIIKGQVGYCKLYDERIATATGINILLQNYKLVKKHEKIIFKQLKKFFTDNNINEIEFN